MPGDDRDEHLIGRRLACILVDAGHGRGRRRLDVESLTANVPQRPPNLVLGHGHETAPALMHRAEDLRPPDGCGDGDSLGPRRFRVDGCGRLISILKRAMKRRAILRLDGDDPGAL